VRSALRTTVALVVAFVAATIVITLIETINGRVLYPGLHALAEGATDREAVRHLLAEAPVGALMVVLAGWAVGTFIGACLAAWIGRRARVAHALALGALIALAGVANNLLLPPPLWFWVAGLAVPVASAWAAARLTSAAARTRLPAA
jgi:hypothetical protein